ncbi:MAG: 3-isopropylmalate dehydratase small subunit [Thermoguttaceae bacterium]
MKPFTKLTGVVVPMDRSDVDTDQLVPKQFLKRVERTGFGKFLFFDWRYNEDGSDNPEFELNKPEFKGASILLSRRNFGCGSSREHAPWAVADYGFRAVIASSFADIFFNNCFKNGILPIKLTEEEIEKLFSTEAASRPLSLTVDLENCTVSDDKGLTISFTVDPFRRECLLKGLDDIGLTLQHEQQIIEYETAHSV